MSPPLQMLVAAGSKFFNGSYEGRLLDYRVYLFLDAKRGKRKDRVVM